MAWMPKADAASALGITTRSLARRLAGGKYETRFDGRRMLVCVPDEYAAASSTPPDEARSAPTGAHRGDMGGRFDRPGSMDLEVQGDSLSSTAPPEDVAEPLTFATTRDRRGDPNEAVERLERVVPQHGDDAAAAASGATWFQDVRNMLLAQVAEARQQTRYARVGERRAQRIARGAATAAGAFLLMALVGLAWLHDQYQSAAQTWADELHLVRLSLQAVEARTEKEAAAVRNDVATVKNESARILAALSDVHRAETGEGEWTTPAAVDELAELRLALAELAQACRSSPARLDAFQPEPLVSPGNSDTRAEKMTLRELIDQSWDGADTAPSGSAVSVPSDAERVSSR